MWYDVVLDALKDTAILFPFLFLMYVLIEIMEHKTRMGRPSRALSGKFAPLIGAATGLVPMCGFSVMAAKLYQHRHITIGTLLAVFAATSDEAFLVLVASPALPWAGKALSLVSMIGIKFLLGVLIGYLVDFLLRRKRAPVCEAPLGESAECCGHDRDAEANVAEEHEGHEEHEEHGHEGHDRDAEGHLSHDGHYTACEHRHKSGVHVYLVSPLLHALEVAAFVLLVNLAFGFLFFGIGGGDAEAGEDLVKDFLQGSGYWFQPLVCCLVGLIPNCASSVILAETYAIGGIAFGSCLAGLVTNAGLGIPVLFRNAKGVKQGLMILVVMFLIGVIAGYAVNAVALCI